jgi:hypothetical protein
MSSKSPARGGNRTRRRFALAGALAGLIGGAAAGAIGGAFGSSIERMAAPSTGEALTGAATGAAVWALAAALAGTAFGLLAGVLVSRRAAFLWTLIAAFFAAIVAAIITGQSGPRDGALIFVLGLVEMFALGVVLRWLYRRRRVLRWFLLGWLALCLLGEGYSRLYPRQFTPLTPLPAEPVALLRCAPLPPPLTVIACHHWILTFDPQEGRWHRWELWQTAGAARTSWGHVCEDLTGPDESINRQPYRTLGEWHGQQARDLMAALHESPTYPERDRYLAWPGPNSTTYIAWVFRRSGVSADLHPMGLGKDYLGTVGVTVTTTRTGLQAETPLLGLKVGLLEGVELHFLCFALGIDTWPPAIKTPFGRIGFEQ